MKRNLILALFCCLAVAVFLGCRETRTTVVLPPTQPAIDLECLAEWNIEVCGVADRANDAKLACEALVALKPAADISIQNGTHPCGRIAKWRVTCRDPQTTTIGVGECIVPNPEVPPDSNSGGKHDT